MDRHALERLGRYVVSRRLSLHPQVLSLHPQVRSIPTEGLPFPRGALPPVNRLDRPTNPTSAVHRE